MRRAGPLLLLSGLPLRRKPSFLRQLTLLASVWNHRGRETFLYGPVFPEGAVVRTAAEAVIALGYPDQFPFLYEKREIGIPCFLWSQFSRVPGQALPEQPVYVPLTPGRPNPFCVLPVVRESARSFPTGSTAGDSPPSLSPDAAG
ncbi:hypothetical protein ES707_09346 [subsurface metagenome]